jgi:hypothetical protein
MDRDMELRDALQRLALEMSSYGWRRIKPSKESPVTLAGAILVQSIIEPLRLLNRSAKQFPGLPCDEAGFISETKQTKGCGQAFTYTVPVQQKARNYGMNLRSGRTWSKAAECNFLGRFGPGSFREELLAAAAGSCWTM